MTATMPAKLLTTRVSEYADETDQDPRDVYVRLLTLVWLARPEVVDAAFARLRTTVRECSPWATG